jgi:DNA-binding response OmpR family regulator
LKILVVDDDPGVRELLTDFLCSRHHQADAVADGPTALAWIAASPPDLVLLDIMMPGMNGLEFMRQLPASAAGMPIIVVTAVGDEEVGRAALKAGAADYVTKPIDLKYLEVTINAVLLPRDV